LGILEIRYPEQDSATSMGASRTKAQPTEEIKRRRRPEASRIEAASRQGFRRKGKPATLEEEAAAGTGPLESRKGEWISLYGRMTGS